MSWEANKIPPLPMMQSGLPDPAAAALTQYDGRMTTRETVQAANEVAQVRSMDAPIRALAASIIGELKNARSEVPSRIAEWIRQNVRYTQETPGIEILQGPYRTLGGNVMVQTPMGPYRFAGTGTGDCDDLSILFATLCRSVGIEAYLAGIAQRRKADSFFHAMGYCNGLFYELSMDGPYGGLNGKFLSSPTPYPNIVALVYDPARKSFSTIDPGNKESNMRGTEEVTHGAGCMCSSCYYPGKQEQMAASHYPGCMCSTCYNPAERGQMGVSEQIEAPLYSPTGPMPVDALQPRYSIPINLYAPSRQISGISMNGSLGSAQNHSPLLSRTDNGMGTVYVPPGTPLSFDRPAATDTGGGAAVQSTIVVTPPPVVTAPPATLPQDTLPGASFPYGKVALAAFAVYLITRK